jgi:hypothetical protein
MFRKNIANMDLPVIIDPRDQLGDLCLMGIADYPFDAGHVGQLFRRPLRVAARNQDTGSGVFAMHAAHGLAHIAIGGRGDSASVEHHQVGLIALRNGDETFTQKQRLESGAISLCGAASEILDEEIAQPLFYSFRLRLDRVFVQLYIIGQRSMSRTCALLAAFFLAAATMFAQLTGRLSGTVIDQAGGSVPNAKVGLYLPGGKNPLLATTTNAEGIFDFLAVRPDLYMLVIVSPGFTKTTQADVRIDPARQTALPPIALSLSTSTQSVEVSANATTVDTASAEIATTVSQAQITNLPVLGRQIVNLFNTQAGVAQNNRTATVINGMRPSYSNVTFDGVNVQDSVRTNDLDLLNNRFTIAQVAEFTVSTTNANPTIGGGASTIVLVSPSGTNQLHGSAYWFNRNNFFGANNWFNNKNGIARPPLNLNQVGGTVGGAIIKDKLFFYEVYEAYRLKQQVPRTNTIPTPTARQGILQYTVGGAVQQFDILRATGLPMSKVVQGLLAQVPAVGNNSSVGDGLNTTGYSFNARSNTTRDNVTSKVDYNLSTKHVFSGSYNWNRDTPDRNDGTYFTVLPPTYNDNRIKLVSASWRWTPTPTLTNELRGGLDFSYIPFLTRQPNPAYFVSGLFFSTPTQSTEIGEGRNNHQYNIQDNANWIHGKHTVSFGFQTSLLTSYAWNYNGNASTNSTVPIYTIGLGTSP